MSTGVGCACGLLCVLDEVESSESLAKKVDMSGRREVEGVLVGWMLCSTGGGVSGVAWKEGGEGEERTFVGRHGGGLGGFDAEMRMLWWYGMRIVGLRGGGRFGRRGGGIDDGCLVQASSVYVCGW